MLTKKKVAVYKRTASIIKRQPCSKKTCFMLRKLYHTI